MVRSMIGSEHIFVQVKNESEACLERNNQDNGSVGLSSLTNNPEHSLSPMIKLWCRSCLPHFVNVACIPKWKLKKSDWSKFF